MLRSMPRRIWLEWLKFYESEPWSETREDYRAAIIASIVYHSAPGRRVRKPIEAFMVRPEETREHRMQAFHQAFMRRARRVDNADH